MKPLHVKIKLLREEKKWSLHEMAGKIPMSHTAYRKIEDGDTQPAWDRVLRISEIHNISPDELVRSKVITRKDIEKQNAIDDVFDVLHGMNLELQKIRFEHESIKTQTKRTLTKKL